MKTYKNPIRNREDFADPFVLRFNGKYYLYCTTPRIDCWSSQNLVEWQLEGPVISEEEFPGLVPFAPEVVYWNGIFYMYTSPHGLGHYVLKSSSPTGPFHKITENIGHSIDLSVFLDDDGSWYGYWADDQGIMGCRMESPTEFGEPVLVGAYLHGWTEGPFVVKRSGRYHLTYTGNHYLSRGYRINGAVSDHPLGPYRDNSCNPVIVRTEGAVTGLGHSSTVRGPDLCTDYIVYHNMKPDRTRGLNIDPIMFDSKRAYILGPTVMERPVPLLPDWSEELAGKEEGTWKLSAGTWEACAGDWVSEGAVCAVNTQLLPAAGVAEFHLAALPGTERYGLFFPEVGHCGLAFPGEAALCLEISVEEHSIFLKNGKEKWTEALLPKPFLHEALHEIRVEYGEGLIVYVDGLKRLESDVNLGERQFGYYGDGGLRIGSTAFSHLKYEEAVYPIPGTLPQGQTCTFEVLEKGRYQFHVIGCSNPSGKGKIDEEEVPDGFWDPSSGFRSFLCELELGRHVLDPNGLEADYIGVAPYYERDAEKIQVKDLGPYDKYCGSQKQTEVNITARLQVDDKGPDWQAGVLFRAGQLADGGEGSDKELGTNFFIGYRVALSRQGIRLWKHRYAEQLLAENAAGALADGKVELQIVTEENHIMVYREGKLVIDYHDPEPVMYGCSGFHVRDCRIVEGEIW